MSPMSFFLNQEVWAVRDTGRWNEPVGVKGRIIGMSEYLTSDKRVYQVRSDNGTVYEVEESRLQEINDPEYKG